MANTANYASSAVCTAISLQTAIPSLSQPSQPKADFLVQKMGKPKKLLRSVIKGITRSSKDDTTSRSSATTALVTATPLNTDNPLEAEAGKETAIPSTNENPSISVQIPETQNRDNPEVPESARIAKTDVLTSDLDDSETPDTSPASSRLNAALVEFKRNYLRFAKANKQYLLLDDDLGDVFDNIDPNNNFRTGAKHLQDQLGTTMKTIEKKHKCIKGTWISKVGRFASKFYPIAKLSLDLTSTIAGVFHIRYSLTEGSRYTTQRCNSWACDYFAGTSLGFRANVAIRRRRRPRKRFPCLP
jgi:hypothetical protein